MGEREQMTTNVPYRRVSTVRRILADLLRAPGDITMPREAHARLVDQANYSLLGLAGAEWLGRRIERAATVAAVRRFADGCAAAPEHWGHYDEHVQELCDHLHGEACELAGEIERGEHVGGGSDGD